MLKSIYILLLFVLISLISCKNTIEKPKTNPNYDKVKINNQFIKVNQQLVKKENDEMDYYQKAHQLNFVKTKSGVRYLVYKPSLKGDSIHNGDVLQLNYTLSLLDGTLCYSSEKDGVKQFKVGMQDVEDGLHKAVLYLKSGDRALILIPSHLAHGLLGDSKRIPPQMPIIYDLEIISVVKEEGSNEDK